MRNLLKLCIVTAVIGFAGFQVYSHNTDKNDDKVSAQANTYQAPDTTEFKTQVEAIIASYPSLQIGVSLVNLSNNDQINLGVQDPFDAASTNKLVTATYFLSQVDEGKESLSDSIQGQSPKTLLEKMIVNSDNDAWKTMNDYLGRENIQTYASSLGLSTYSVENNRISVTDEAKLLSKIYDQDTLSKTNKTLLLSYMKKADNRGYIVAAVPATDTVYHKAGYLKDRVHDAAIIETGSEKYALVIFTKSSGQYNFEAGQVLFSKITKASLATFQN